MDASKRDLLNSISELVKTTARKIPQDEHYRQCSCMKCNGNNLLRFLMKFENRFRPNGVEIDRRDYFFYCWDCKLIFENNDQRKTNYLISENMELATEDILQNLKKCLESNKMQVEDVY